MKSRDCRNLTLLLNMAIEIVSFATINMLIFQYSVSLLEGGHPLVASSPVFGDIPVGMVKVPSPLQWARPEIPETSRKRGGAWLKHPEKDCPAHCLSTYVHIFCVKQMICSYLFLFIILYSNLAIDNT